MLDTVKLEQKKQKCKIISERKSMIYLHIQCACKCVDWVNEAWYKVKLLIKNLHPIRIVLLEIIW